MENVCLYEVLSLFDGSFSFSAFSRPSRTFCLRPDARVHVLHEQAVHPGPARFLLQSRSCFPYFQCWGQWWAGVYCYGSCFCVSMVSRGGPSHFCEGCPIHLHRWSPNPTATTPLAPALETRKTRPRLKQKASRTRMHSLFVQYVYPHIRSQTGSL